MTNCIDFERIKQSARHLVIYADYDKFNNQYPDSFDQARYANSG